MKTKTLDLTFARMVCKRNEIAERNAKATAYSESVQNRRRQSKHFLVNICKGIAVVGVTFVTITACVLAVAKAEPRYAIPSNNTSGFHYTYVTERYCTVTEITGDLITVAYNGNLYDFFGYGYEVGEEIICQFTDSMEIVGVVE
jgi:hypothetical protein